jgi:formyl-CoA transferase
LGDNAGRVQRVADIDAAIEAYTLQHSVDEVLEMLEQAEVPGGRIYSIADIANDAHYQARGMIQNITLADGSSLSVPGVVPKLSRTPGGLRNLAPTLGQDTDAVLTEMGLTPAQIQTLRERGVVA